MGRLRAAFLPCGPLARLPYAGPLRPPHLQGDSFYGERVTRKPGGGRSPATPLRFPTPPREKVSLRSPLSDGGKASSGTGVPIQEATTENRSPLWVLIDRSPGRRQSCPPQGITTGSLVSSYHQYSSEYGAGTCPRVAETQPFLFSPEFPGNGGKPHRTSRSLAGPTEEAHR